VAQESEPLFVVNPASGNGAAGKRWQSIEAQARSLGIAGESVLTTGPGDATRLTRDALAGGRRLIVAVGGDGTVNEVVNGFFADGALVAPEAELALLQIGTGRDTIRTYGIPKQPEKALQVLLDGRSRAIDVGRASFTAPDGSESVRMFANHASCGLSGVIAERANRTSKRLGGTACFMWATVTSFFGWHNVQFRVEIDGEEHDQLANNVLVGNGRFLAGGMRMFPEAEPDDGLLEVLVWGDVTKLDLTLAMHRLYRGTHLTHPKLQVARARRVRVSMDPPLPVELDGEQPGSAPISFEVVPGALKLRVPA
jgi:YegS/Rv2252/BmrU family lipid kinase